MEHFVLALIAAMVITITMGPAQAFFAVLILSIGKEAYDLMFNPWGLNQVDLLDDIIIDMIFNIVGMFAGIILGLVIKKK